MLGSLPIIAFVILCARVVPRYIGKWANMETMQKTRLCEEATSLVWYLYNTVYMLHTHVSYDFFFQSSLALDVQDSILSKHDNVRVLLIQHISFYFGLLIISIWPPRRRDYKEMVMHHVITIGLMLVAYIVGFYDVSVFVLFINGVCDIFLSASKMAYDLEHPLQTPLFAVFVAGHLILRVIYYPYKVWRCFFDSMEEYNSAFDYLPGLCTIPLWILYVFWTPKIFRVCWNRVINGVRNVDKSVCQKKSTKK
jgi:hypothetical protein